MVLNIGQANDINVLLRYLLGAPQEGEQAPTSEQARHAAQQLAHAARARLGAGLSATDVAGAWDGAPASRLAQLPPGDITVDAVVLSRRMNTGELSEPLRVLLVRRRPDSDAYPGAWAIPGGYLDPGERLADAALRELGEETGLDTTDINLRMVGAYDSLKRDPRGRVISVAYVGTVDDCPPVHGRDDVDAAQWVPVKEATGLAFDHGRILADAEWQFWRQRW